MKVRCAAVLCLDFVVLALMLSPAAAFVGEEQQPGVTWVNDRSWDAGGGADVNWSTAANWSNDTEPGPNDRATFNRAAATAVYLDANKTVSDVLINASGQHTFSNAAATLNVTTSFTFSCDWDRGVFTFNPVLNLSGVFTSRWSNANQDQQLASALTFANAGNTIGRGMDVNHHMITFSGNNNTFSGGIKVRGWQEWLSAQNSRYAGHVYLDGTGNNFGIGQFELYAGGYLRIKNSSNLSNITNIQWRGGTLQLGMSGAVPANTWAYPAFTGGFEVKRGTLLVNSDVNLGNVAYALILGSAGGYGVLKGDPADSAGNRIDRPITLSGNGGVFYPVANGGSGGHQYIGSVISGPGELIKVSPWNTYLRNAPYSVQTLNTYQGGTRVVGGILVCESLRSLGAGNLTVYSGGVVDLYSSTNLAGGATVTLKAPVIGKFVAPTGLRLYTEMPIPTITDGSVGLISLDANGTWNTLQTPRNSTIYLGAWSGWKTTACTNIAPNPDGVYRLAGAPNAHHYYSGSSTVFYGTNRMEIGIGGDPFWWNGIVQFTSGHASNSFTGKITIHPRSSLFSHARTDDGTQLGSTNADVELGSQSLLYLYTVNNGKPVWKNNLIVKGQGRLAVWDNNLTTATGVLNFASWTRENYSALEIGSGDPINDPSLGGRERIFIHSGVPALVNGIVPPYLCGPYHFLTYDPTYGFSNAPWTVVANGANFPAGINAGTDIVSVEPPAGTCTLQDDPYVYALRITNALVKGAGTKITIGSGGLIVKERGTGRGVGHVSNADMVFGTVSGSTTNLTEAHIWANAGMSRWVGPELSGQLHCAGLTKNGYGYLTISGNNEATIKGPVVVNNGVLVNGRDDSTPFGSPTNIIIVNGGYLYDDWNGCWLTNQILIGPNGGAFGDAHSGFNLVDGIRDQFPGNAGPVMWMGGYWNYRGETNTFTGGLLIQANGINMWSGVPALGTGPIRVTGDGGYLNNFTTNIMVHPTRVTLQYHNALLGLNASGMDLGSLEGYGLVRFGETWTWCQKPYLTVGRDNTDFEFYGTIFEQQWQSNRGQVTKVGTGTWTLYGIHTYHGSTYVSNGTLCLNGSLEYTTNVVVSPGATLIGKGYIAGPVTVLGNGKLGGSLVLASNVTLNSAAQYTVNLSGGTPVLQYSQATILGTLNLNSASLTLTLNFVPTVGQTFTILNNQGTINGNFAQGNLVSASYGGKTYFFRITYNGGDGNDIVLTVLPQGTMIYMR